MRLARPLLFALAAAVALVLAAGLAARIAWPRYVAGLGPIDLMASREGSTIVVDRDGRLLRPFTLPDGRWRLPATIHEVDPRYIAMLVAYEDGRFYRHRGVDPRALLRAAGQWLLRGHVVSGGSTLTMQVARLIEPRRRAHVRRQAQADRRARFRSSARSARPAFSIATSRSRRSAAISRACARPRSPISARSR